MNNQPIYLRPDHAAVALTLGYNQAETALLEQFAERGYVVIDIDEPDFGALADGIVDALSPDYPEDGRIQDAWKQHAGVKRLATNASLLATLRTLYGRPAFAFQTLNFNKGTEQETHCDTIHFDSLPHGFMAGVWVALEDIDAGNGPLHYFPGSHRLPHVSLAEAGIRSDNGYVDYDRHYLPLLGEIIAAHGFEKEEAHIRKGQAVIWAANLAHGGSPIRTEGRSRHSQVTHYYFDDCGYYTPLLSDPFLGKVAVRAPYDIQTGATRDSRYAGEVVPPAGTARPGRVRRMTTRLLDRLGL